MAGHELFDCQPLLQIEKRYGSSATFLGGNGLMTKCLIAPLDISLCN